MSALLCDQLELSIKCLLCLESQSKKADLVSLPRVSLLAKVNASETPSRFKLSVITKSLVALSHSVSTRVRKAKCCQVERRHLSALRALELYLALPLLFLYEETILLP